MRGHIISLVTRGVTLRFLPGPWQLPLFGVLGVMAALGVLLLRVSEAHSYLTDDPRACINCHVMVPEYATWERSSHRNMALCTDCHVPHDSLFRKYAFKARDGLRHSTLFALRREPQVIRATAHAEQVIQENCLNCHARQLASTPMLRQSERRCVECHREIPHGQVHSLASTPNVPYPHLPPVTTRLKFGE